jgi:hypothetical protein
MTSDPVERLLGDIDRPLTPRPVFAQTLLDRLLVELEPEAGRERDPGGQRQEDPIITATVSRPAPSVLPSRGRSLRRQRHRNLGPLASAALLVFTLTAGYLMLHPVQPSTDRPLSLPAIVAPASPAIDPAGQETLVSVTLPAGAIPTSSNLDVIGWSATLDPGTATDAVPGCCRGPQIVHVLAGELTLRVDGPLQVIRATGIGAASDTVPTNTAVILNPGDSAFYAYDLVASYANRASSSLHLVGGSVLAGWVRDAPAGLTVIDYNYAYPILTISAGPVAVTLIRATLPPGGTIPAPPPGAIVIDVGGLADADIGKDRDGALRNLGPTEATFYVLSVEPMGIAQGVTATPPAP